MTMFMHRVVVERNAGLVAMMNSVRPGAFVEEIGLMQFLIFRWDLALSLTGPQTCARTL